MNRVSQVRAITLDLYGTLLDVESSVLQGFQVFLRGRGVAATPREVVKAWETAYFQETMIETLLGQGRTPFEQVSRRCLEQVLEQLGVSHSAGDLEGLLASRDSGSLYPGVQEGLKALRGRYTLAVLSNGDLASLHRAVSNLAIPVDQIISAEQAGVYKPHPAVYRTALEVLGLEAGQVMHAASHVWDVRGARAAGLLGAYVNRTGVVYGDARLLPDVTVSSFIELAEHPCLAGG
ncbi:MAG: haloacid dehalogenase type II [Dehalococcoidia bacterium]|nr:haloacid dehalogenase type II [Dehalococcoidia bacterium]MSQ17232.1 haloacid dehalogenase type II [Dehalococcoidia bacterium]